MRPHYPPAAGLEQTGSEVGRRRRIAWLLRLTATALAIGSVVACGNVRGALEAGAGYKAKALASRVFLSGRDAERVARDDLSDGPMALVWGRVGPEGRSAYARALGLVGSKAICRDGLGCTLVNGLSEKEIRSQPLDPPRAWSVAAERLPWPDGDALIDGPAPTYLDTARLGAAIDEIFSEPAGGGRRETRALVVVHRGRIVAERYAEGFAASTPLPGWSMTKSVMNALIGIRILQGRLELHAAASVPEWRGDGDPRAAITLDQLMRMSSGLAFTEVYEDFNSDVVRMLFTRGDAGGYAAAKPLAHAPDTHWYYSSGTTNLVSRILRATFDRNQAAYFAFPRRALFERIGMRSAVIEPDASGTFVGSSFMFATARDWARFGLLFLEDGVWNGKRLLPEGWVRYSTTPTPLAPQGRYGAHWWLNAGDPADPNDRPWPALPRDAFAAAGFEGQYVLVVPSRRLVLVRLGLSRPEHTFSLNDFGAAVLAAIGD